MTIFNGPRKREDVFEEIVIALRGWTDLDRRIFTQSHYHGQSMEEIARFFNLDIEEVSRILQQCNRELYTSLGKFPENRNETFQGISIPRQPA